MISKIWQIGFAHTKGLKIKVNTVFLENNSSDIYFRKKIKIAVCTQNYSRGSKSSKIVSQDFVFYEITGARMAKVSNLRFNCNNFTLWFSSPSLRLVGKFVSKELHAHKTWLLWIFGWSPLALYSARFFYYVVFTNLLELEWIGWPIIKFTRCLSLPLP